MSDAVNGAARSARSANMAFSTHVFVLDDDALEKGINDANMAWNPAIKKR